jgi:hypothetical protein
MIVLVDICCALCCVAGSSANSARASTFKGLRFPFGVNFAVTSGFGGNTKTVRRNHAACEQVEGGCVCKWATLFWRNFSWLLHAKISLC